MILINDILELHEKSIVDFGGSHGIRDIGLLESAIARPFQTFGGEDLYRTTFEKAAALAESVIINHPFVDGNKRTGMLAMVSLLLNGQFLMTLVLRIIIWIFDSQTFGLRRRVQIIVSGNENYRRQPERYVFLIGF